MSEDPGPAPGECLLTDTSGRLPAPVPTQDRTRAARAAVEDEVQALEASLAADDAGDAARRRALGTRLEALRARWRENPALFTPAVVATLRAVARALARAPRPDRPLPAAAPSRARARRRGASRRPRA